MPTKPKTASETPPEGQQDTSSEPKGQETGSEGTSDGAQEQLAQLRKQLLEDPSFIEELVASPQISARLQADRDRYVHAQTLSLKQEMERLQSVVEAASAANDPVMMEYRRLKEEGDYEAALALLENHQDTSEREARARRTGEQEAATAILTKIRNSSAFAELTQDEWTTIYATAASEAQQQGRAYITVDEYVAGATKLLREKDKSKMSTEEQNKAVEEAVEAALKRRGIERREEEGGPEDLAGRRGAVGSYTDEQVMDMSQEEWNALSDEDRKTILRRGAELTTRS